MISKYIFYILIIAGSFSSILGQNSYSLLGGNGIVGDILPFELEDGMSVIIRTLGYEDSWTKYPYIQIVSFDECGPNQQWTYNSDQITNISRLRRVLQNGDYLYIALDIFPGPNIFSYIESGILKVNLKTGESEYNAMRGKNSMSNLDFKIMDNGNLMLYYFVSYTDFDPSYAIFILNSKFEILDFFEFRYNYYAISGNCKQISDGWICTHAFSIFRLNDNLDPLWMIETKDRNNYWQMELVEDGFIVRTARYINSIRHMSLNKFDFDGNLVWRTPNLAKEDFKTSTSSTSKLVITSDGNFDLMVSNNDFQAQQNSLYRYVINSRNGEIIFQQQIIPSSNNDNFVFKDYTISSDKVHQIILSDYSNNHQIIQFSKDNNDCISTNENLQTSDPAPIIFNNVAVPERRWGDFYGVTYAWRQEEMPLTFDLICEDLYEFEDLLPDDTLICAELGLTLNLSDLELPIVWDDGDTNKIKSFTEQGNYSYDTYYCRQEFSESFELQTEQCSCDFEVANIFSPNGDGVNDMFELNTNCQFITDFEFSVFDRWGALLFKSNSIDLKWDGKFNGKSISNGVYTYYLTYKDVLNSNEIIQKSSTITILK